MPTKIGWGLTITGASTGLLGEIIDVSGPNQSVDVVDISNMDSPSAGMEKIAGMIDAGDCSFAVNFDGSAAGTADALQTALNGRTSEVWTIALIDAETIVATGFLSALGYELPTKDKMTQTVTITFTGLVAFTDQA